MPQIFGEIGKIAGEFFYRYSKLQLDLLPVLHTTCFSMLICIIFLIEKDDSIEGFDTNLGFGK